MSKARQIRRLTKRFAAFLEECRELTPYDKKFCTVQFSTCGDYPHNDTIFAEVYHDRAHEWADSDGYIGGSSWETPSDMPGFAYAMPGNHDGLIEELRADGYDLDLTGYKEVIKDCAECGCKDPECYWRAQWKLTSPLSAESGVDVGSYTVSE